MYVFFFNRNNSARELSAFAESAMAVNRVVLQHFSMNGDTLVDSYLSTEDEVKKGIPFGLSPPSESRLIQRRLLTKSQTNTQILPVIASPSG